MTTKAVIPLNMVGDNPTVVDTPEAFQRCGGVEGTTLLIHGLQAEQLAGGQANTSYDLRVGQEYRNHRDSGKMDLMELLAHGTQCVTGFSETLAV